MAKQRSSSGLHSLSGKRLVFSGKFDYGVEDSLKAMAEARQGKVVDDLDAKTDYLVLADLNAGKTVQKKVVALNAKGATIQLLDADAFRKLAELTDEEVLELLRSGQSETYAKMCRTVYTFHPGKAAKIRYHGEKLDSVQLKRAAFDEIRFDGCSFVGAVLDHARFVEAPDCDFSKATGDSSEFGEVTRGRFHKSELRSCNFFEDFSGANFSGANLEKCAFGVRYAYGRTKRVAQTDVNFTKANLTSALFSQVHFKSANFGGADLTSAQFERCKFDAVDFSRGTLRNASLVGCQLAGANLSHADLTGANLAGADLTRAVLAGANLKNANLRGTKLDGVDLAKAKNYDPAGAKTGAAGPALTELDQIISKARRILVTFLVRSSPDEEGELVEIDSSGLQHGWGVRAGGAYPYSQGRKEFSTAMLEIASVLGNQQPRLETLDVSSTKSPTGGKELRDLVLQGIAEAFALELPDDEKLAAATKEYRDAQREKGAAARQQREETKAEAAKQKEKAKKQIAKKIEKTVGKVSDTASFLKALELRIEKPKIDKATKMLKASGFKLFNDVTDEHVSGVVKSQTDPDLVYACRVSHDGQYACCTQNLNICGGLRGSICKHQLVLIIGLVQAGELDPTTIDAWIAKTHSAKPELDKETMGAIFIKYKGAEAGEVDWRPTETMPEDYYAL